MLCLGLLCLGSLLRGITAGQVASDKNRPNSSNLERSAKKNPFSGGQCNLSVRGSLPIQSEVPQSENSRLLAYLSILLDFAGPYSTAWASLDRC